MLELQLCINLYLSLKFTNLCISSFFSFYIYIFFFITSLNFNTRSFLSIILLSIIYLLSIYYSIIPLSYSIIPGIAAAIFLSVY